MGVVLEKKISVHGEKVNKRESKVKGGGPDGAEILVIPSCPMRRLKNSGPQFNPKPENKRGKVRPWSSPKCAVNFLPAKRDSLIIRRPKGGKAF